ncbi:MULTISPECIES: TerC family protein [unclassified Azospirillum]|uniref:TerC family protein n=1 Tax=unclassified Azospirillum TaxID=2630922 RepID=UPI000B6A96BD|nr:MULTISPECIES: TerC family protein [unclassified Azospirillum]SNR84332.1 Membrane protein TerC, possibly involved in tellurium resistance [Azospirillum sp. RU38E]SNR99991.1 Membrane protein TerC, possibly involved in tellurium resistance [Azospirillum sp. RU37A]
MFEWLSDPNAWASLLTLTALEIVLGIDNIIFISIMANRLPEHQQAKARQFGLALALISRLALLASIAWIVKLTDPIFTVFDMGISVRDLILLFGGLFLLYKGTAEIHHTMEGHAEDGGPARAAATFSGVIMQIMVLDIVFSLDSVITAVGMASQLPVMITAVVIAVAVMLFAAGPTSRFVQNHPTVKMLALSFLILVGVALIADGLHFHIPKGYLYFAIAFSVAVEMLNLAASKRRRRKEGAAGH